MLERFTAQAREVVVRTQVTARSLGRTEVDPAHVLLAVLADADAPGVATLARLGVTEDTFRAGLQAGGAGFAPEDADALRTLGIDLDEIRRQVEGAFGPGALDAAGGDDTGAGDTGGRWFRRGRPDGTGHLWFTARAKRGLAEALRDAQSRGDREIGVEHVLLGTLTVLDGPALDVLRRLGVSPDAARAAVLADLDAAA